LVSHVFSYGIQAIGQTGDAAIAALIRPCAPPPQWGRLHATESYSSHVAAGETTGTIRRPPRPARSTGNLRRSTGEFCRSKTL
jgi:hypothetical protein